MTKRQVIQLLACKWPFENYIDRYSGWVGEKA